MEAETPKADQPIRKHRWYQFSLRTLFVVMTIVAVQCAVCFPPLREWRERRVDDAYRELSEALNRQNASHPNSGRISVSRDDVRQALLGE